TSGDAASGEVWFRIRDAVGATEFLGYSDLTANGSVSAIVANGVQVDALHPGDQADLILDRTPFYAESGGQAGDHGVIEARGARFIVRDVQKRAGDLHAHVGELVEGDVSVGDPVTASVNGDRRKRIMANHSATHLMHAALRDVLGEHVTQKGSLVEEERMRFDFSHGAPVTPAQIEAIEDQVNEVIRQNNPVGVSVTSPEKAIEAGALALFGEKYGDEVRVLSMGADLKSEDKAYSVELCGGTHVERTGDIGTFVILSESGVSAGVRRIEVATGAEAIAFLRGRAQVAVDLSDQLKVPLKDVAKKVVSLTEERKTLERQLADTKRALAMAGESGAPSDPEEINGVNLIARVAEGVGGKDLRALIDEAKAQMKSGIAVFVGVNDGKAAVAVGVTEDLVGTHSAVDLVRVASAEVGGKGGGGRPDMAQAGGPDGSNAEAALEAVRTALKG
ncbi:MAG: DHHA1 domain-containing protein, partial [Pseudomonadota bacterium]